jgi:predicted HicB family RNase H-like nuclease
MEKKTVNLNVRMPADLHDRVKQQASRDMRSLNLEVLWLLERGLESVKSADEPERKQADAG